MVQINIDMPSDCFSCWIRQNMGCKIANASGWLSNKRDSQCPLKEKEDTNNGCYVSYWIPIFCAKCGAFLGSREIKIKKDGTNNG